MELSSILFWTLSVLTVFCALMVLLSKNPVNSVLWLIATFFTISGHYVLMNAQFLAIVNIIVYAGAIMVLFLFVVMLINFQEMAAFKQRIGIKIAGLLAAGSLLLVLLSVARTALLTPISNHTVHFNTGEIGLVENLGLVLFMDYAIPFELCSVLFLSAMVGAVVIGKKK